MNIREKQELVRLLILYMEDLVSANCANISKARSAGDKKKWETEFQLGVKTQYEHARIIASKLSVEIGKEIKSYWEL